MQSAIFSKLRTRFYSFTLAFLILGYSSAASHAESGIIDEYPDVLNCTSTSGSIERIYRIVSKVPSSGVVAYYHVYNPDLDANVAYLFNGDGTFNANEHSSNSNCDGSTLASLISSGAAFYTRNQDTSGTSGQISYFNLSECPDEWTRQIQLDRTINPDEPMVLCRKD